MQNYISKWATLESKVMEEAIEAYVKLSISHFPEATTIGGTLNGQDKPEERQAYKKAIAIQPDYVGPHLNMGFTLQQQGKLEKP